MYKTFQWTNKSFHRNKLSQKCEPLQPFFFLEIARTFRPDIVLDLGANIGLYSIFVADQCPNAEIHSFEPAPETFEELSKNIELNNFQNKISAHQIAISNSNGEKNFGIVNALSGANSIHSTTIHPEAKFNDYISVDVRPLDQYIQAANKKLMMKIDVEGHENNALSGAEEILLNNEVVLQIEDYGTLDKKYLNDLGFSYLLRLGGDTYFCNNKSSFPENVIIEKLQNAANLLIDENKNPDKRIWEPKEKEVNVKLLPDVHLSIKGKIGRILRRIKNKKRG